MDFQKWFMFSQFHSCSNEMGLSRAKNKLAKQEESSQGIGERWMEMNDSENGEMGNVLLIYQCISMQI